MEKKINPVLQRLSDFADSKGGFAEIGRRIQKHPSMFYNLIRRDALPSVNTLTEIASEFPDLDFNFILKGKKLEVEPTSEESQRIKALENRNQVLQSLYEEAAARLQSAKRKGAFLQPDVVSMRRQEAGRSAIRNSRESEKNRKERTTSVRVPGASEFGRFNLN